MMPSKFRVTSATAAGLVGLVVAGLILFGTDPLGMATTNIAVPAPQAAAASRTSAGVDSKPGHHSTSKPSRHHRPRHHLTKRSRPAPHDTYRPRPAPTVPRPRITFRTRPTYAAPTVHPTTERITTARPSVKPTATSSPTAASRPSATPTASATPSSATPTATTYPARADWAAAVLSSLNSQRAEHGLPALTSNSKLVTSAHRHNLAMAQANQLSHQLSGEPSLGSRISAAGYSWSSVGENIAYNSNRSQAGVLALQQAMYNETAPNDGHRRNILSSSFREVGVDVIDDPGHGKVWLVTDFGRP
jgi:uncharacterized protein YkwD